MKRRNFLTYFPASAAAVTLMPASFHSSVIQAANAKNGRVKQSVARWCFADIPIEPLCEALQDMGVTGMDLAGPEDWSVCERYGILPCLVQGAGSFLPAAPDSDQRFGPSFGWNKIENHAELMTTGRQNIELASAAGLPNVIGLFGDADGMTDEEGIENCVIGLRQIVPLLEEKNITLGLEVLNSIVDHPGYQGNNTAYGVEVIKRVSSEHVKLVFDAYHMQIMEGNLISNIRQNIDSICHFHIAGVPGRHEIDETQEVNWRAIATAIADLGFSGYMAHEWTPTTDDPLEQLRKAVDIITV